MDINFSKISEACADFLTLDDLAFKRLKKYAEILVEWNEKMNLTAFLPTEMKPLNFVLRKTNIEK